MAFINHVETIVKKSNKDTLVFYTHKNDLILRTFIHNKGWLDLKKILSDVISNQFNIQIDKNDEIYGIANNLYGEILYLYTDNNLDIKYKKLFNYDNEKYIIKYPYIIKNGDNIHVFYYIRDIKDYRVWSILSHYFDGEKWENHNIEFIKSYPIINPFIVTQYSDDLNIFYFNKVGDKEEVFYNQFSYNTQQWSKSQKLTNTKNKKIYLDVLKDNNNLHHITWSEFINDNLTIRYINRDLNKEIIHENDEIILSEQSNCSFPTIIKAGDVLWTVWAQMNKVYSCNSFDQGYTWDEPRIDNNSSDNDIIRYKFITNDKAEVENFKLNTAFGLNYPKISFVGFENIKTK